MYPFSFSKHTAAFYITFALTIFCAGVWSIVLGPYVYGTDGKGLPSAAGQIREQSTSLSRVSALLAS